MCVAHSIAPPAAHFDNVSLCLLVVIPNITSLLRLGIKPGPPACQSDALTTTLPAPRVLKCHCIDAIYFLIQSEHIRLNKAPPERVARK